jgi:hypothetical protein
LQTGEVAKTGGFAAFPDFFCEKTKKLQKKLEKKL